MEHFPTPNQNKDSTNSLENSYGKGKETLLKDLGKEVKNFTEQAPYSKKVANDFHFFMHALRSLLDTFKDLPEDKKEEAKGCILSGINLLDSKKEEYSNWATTHIDNSPLLRADEVSSDYFYIYSQAALIGLIEDKDDLIKNFVKSLRANEVLAYTTLADLLQEKFGYSEEELVTMVNTTNE